MMKLILSDVIDESDEEQIIVGLWKHNHQFSPVDIHPLRIAVKDSLVKIKGGIIARTWWSGLDIQYLWVTDEYRLKGHGRRLMTMAEDEAVNRDCHFAYVDTLSFQALLDTHNEKRLVSTKIRPSCTHSACQDVFQ